MKGSKVLLWIAVLVLAVLSIGMLSACSREYTVTFDGNGGFLVSNIEEIPLTQTVKKPSQLKEPVFGRYGYEMAGWDTDLATLKTDATVKAVWTVSEYRIIFDLAGGREDKVNPKKYTIESADITLNAPVKTGYEFIGWTGTGVSTPSKEVVINSGSYGNKTYTAHWEVKQYSITYNLNEGVQVEATPASYNILSTNQYIKNPVREGYDFIGWTGTGLTEMTMNVVIPTGSFGDREYTANWKAKEFDLNFDLNGGTVDGQTSINPYVVTYDQPIGTLPEPDAENKIFDGWYYGDVLVTENTVFNYLEPITLKAKFADAYTVKFVLVTKVGSATVTCLYDGSKEKADETVNIGSSLSDLKDATIYVKDEANWYFEKWVYINADGQEVEITKDTVFNKDVFTRATVNVIAKCMPASWGPTFPD